MGIAAGLADRKRMATVDIREWERFIPDVEQLGWDNGDADRAKGITDHEPFSDVPSGTYDDQLTMKLADMVEVPVENESVMDELRDVYYIAYRDAVNDVE